MSDHPMYANDCRACGAYDYGFDMSDVRATLHIGEAPEDGDDTRPEVRITIDRVYDQWCPLCEGATYRCVFVVSLDGATIKRLPSEAEADAFVARVFPTAVEPEPDWAWESERFLRQAEGWG